MYLVIIFHNLFFKFFIKFTEMKNNIAINTEGQLQWLHKTLFNKN